MLPVVCGVKLMPKLQFAPGNSEKVLVQFVGAPEPATKFALTLKPGETSFSCSLPMFCIVTDCGLSVLVLPTAVEAKVNVGGCEDGSSTTSGFAMKISPAASTATPDMESPVVPAT